MNKKGNKRDMGKKVRTLVVLNDASLSTTEKVKELLKIKQEGKEFQDIGEWVAGSSKESAAIRTVHRHEDEAYMNTVSQEFDKYKLDEKIKQRMLENVRKTYGYEVGTQRLINKGDELRAINKPKEAIKQYLDALNLMKKYHQEFPKDADDLWCKKAIFMACNGMGIAYSKWGKPMEAIDNFEDAVLYAPSEGAKQITKANLEKYQKALKDKTGVEVISHFID